MDSEKKGKSRGNPAFSFLGRSCIEKGAAATPQELVIKAGFQGFFLPVLLL